MPHLEAVASPAIFVMLLACILGVGFMLRFLIALTVDERTMHGKTLRAPVAHSRRVHYAADIASGEAPYRQTTLGSAAHLAMGVARITTALASNAGRRRNPASTDQLHVAPFNKAGRTPDFTAERRYRSG